MQFRKLTVSAALAAGLTLAAVVPATADEPAPSPTTDTLTVATFNASLNRGRAGELLEHLATGDNQQARNAAETIQRINPDIILVNEFDYDAEHRAADLFRKNYLEVSQNGAAPVEYPYVWTGPVNTGVPSGFDLNNDGEIKPGDDAWGFGLFPGQYGFVVYSKYPIQADQVRTFQNFRWQDMPGALLPQQADGSPWYAPEEIAKFPLSSKTHADIPVDINGTIVHVLAAHPTPPAFDGPEIRNQKRNHDEIRLWADYISGAGTYLYDDNGSTGTLPSDANFVILGDYNADPVDGSSYNSAILQLLDNPRVLDPKPSSAGGAQEGALQGGVNPDHKADPKYDTADFGDARTGNLRVDYVLPNQGAVVEDAQVFWPTRDDELFRLTGLDKDPNTGERTPFPTSDHRAVWIKVKFPAQASPTPSPTPSPTATATASPAPAPSTAPSSPQAPAPTASVPAPPASPAPSATLTRSASPAPAASASPSGRAAPGSLARTGVDVLGLTAVAAVALAGGALLLVRRRRS